MVSNQDPPIWFYARVSSCELDVFLVLAVGETTKDLTHSSSWVSMVLIRRMFTLRIRGSTKMESTAMNPIITFTPRQGKPHTCHMHCVVYCEFTWLSAINVRGLPVFVLLCSCPVQKHSGQMITKSLWWSVDICISFQEHTLWTVQLLSVFSGSTHWTSTETNIPGCTGLKGAGGRCQQLWPFLSTPRFCLWVQWGLWRSMLMVRRSRRSKRTAIIEHEPPVLDVGLGKHLMRDSTVCKQAEAQTSSSFHRHLTSKATTTHTDRQQR